MVKVYLLVDTLPFSQYSYVKTIKDMKMDTYINCNHPMFEYFGRSTLIMVYDNLMASIVMHPKNDKIILTNTYSDFGNQYMMTTINACRGQRAKADTSVDDTIRKMETLIITSLRNIGSLIHLRNYKQSFKLCIQSGFSDGQVHRNGWSTSSEIYKYGKLIKSIRILDQPNRNE